MPGSALHPLAAYGWTNRRDAERAVFPGLDPARVVLQERDAYLVRGAAGEQPAEVSGRYRHDARVPADYPAVGDWVLTSGSTSEARAQIQRVLPRRGVLSRASARQRVGAQVLAANVDVVFIVSSAEEQNARRLERFLLIARESGARPVVVLNKIDRCADREETLAAVMSVAGADVDLRPVSALTGAGIGGLAAYLEVGRTVVLLGPSGVGKSTLTNALLGSSRQTTGGLRADGRGRHTTTRRELLLAPGGGLIIDTPGIRELQLRDEDVDVTFADVALIGERCRFSDCAHESEPGCAAREAVANGALDSARLAAFRKIERELSAHPPRGRRD